MKHLLGAFAEFLYYSICASFGLLGLALAIPCLLVQRVYFWAKRNAPLPHK